MRSAVKIDQDGWQAIADELAAALRTTMLRNPTVSALDWDRAQAALGRYESAGGAVPATLPEQSEEQASS
jgi:hypothetical protein